MREWEEQYRKKIYPKLTTEQKKKRNLREINGKLYCDLMPKTRRAYFKEDVNNIIRQMIGISRMEKRIIEFPQGWCFPKPKKEKK